MQEGGIEETNESNFFYLISNEDYPSLWQAEFLIYLVFFKIIIVVGFIASAGSFICIYFCFIVMFDVVGIWAIKTFSVALNKIYLASLAFNCFLLMLTVIFEANGDLADNKSKKLQVLFATVVFAYEIYQIWAHIRFHGFLSTLNNVKKRLYTEYMSRIYI